MHQECRRRRPRAVRLGVRSVERSPPKRGRSQAPFKRSGRRRPHGAAQRSEDSLGVLSRVFTFCFLFSFSFERAGFLSSFLPSPRLPPRVHLPPRLSPTAILSTEM